MLLESMSVGDALKKVKDPREFRYMKILRYSLKLLGAWPGKGLQEVNSTKYEVVPAYFLVFVKVVSIFSGILYIRRHSSLLTLLDLGHNYIIIFMSFVTLSRLFTLSLSKKYRSVVKRFVTELHLYYYKNDSKYAMETHVNAHKSSFIITIYLNILLAAGVISFNTLTIYINYTKGNFDSNNKNNKTFELGIYFELPFDAETSFKGYIAVSIYNWYATYICCSVFCIFELVLFIMIFHIRGHFKILIHNLKSFPKPAAVYSNERMMKDVLNEAQLYSNNEMIEIEHKLKQCIDYHRMLIKFTNDLSKVFGPMLLFYYIFHQISGCLLLLEISQMTAVTLIKYGPLTLALFQQLIQLSFIVESIGTVTGKLKNTVYEVPWEHMHLKNRKTLMIFLMNVQEPLHINALGLAKVGVASTAAILKTTLSYFAFLRSVSE